MTDDHADKPYNPDDPSDLRPGIAQAEVEQVLRLLAGAIGRIEAARAALGVMHENGIDLGLPVHAAVSAAHAVVDASGPTLMEQAHEGGFWNGILAMQDSTGCDDPDCPACVIRRGIIEAEAAGDTERRDQLVAELDELREQTTREMAEGIVGGGDDADELDDTTPADGPLWTPEGWELPEADEPNA